MSQAFRIALLILLVWRATPSPAQDSGAAGIYDSKRGFGLRISVELRRDGAVRTVSPNTTFRGGDQIRLHFKSNFDGYVYALNEAPDGKTKLLFPTPETGGGNVIRTNQDYMVPATRGWFRMAGQPGEERVHMIISPRSLPEIEKIDLAEAPPATDEGSLTSAVDPGPRPSAQATGSASTANSANAAASQTNTAATNNRSTPNSQQRNSTNPVTQTQRQVGKVQSGISLGNEIRRLPRDVTRIIPGLGSKDLVFEDDLVQGASYVSTLPASTLPAGTGDPVIFTVVLVHR
jgi:hypothetical protein